MDAETGELDLPETWRAAIASARAKRRILVLGATDMGKSSFIRAALTAIGAEARLIDLDPGQKMIGPPGSVARGRLDVVERFIFIGTTSASALGAIADAARTLAEGSETFVVNTSGFVTGIGARLQLITARAIEPDLIIQIGDEPIVSVLEVPLIRIERSARARRKSPAFRRRLRQDAFEREFDGASKLTLRDVELAPGALAPWHSPARPVCSLADAEGTDMALGIIESTEEGALFVHARATEKPVKLIRLGAMWVEPKDGGWLLQDRLQPSWA